MINEKLTSKIFGYKSWELSKKSDKNVFFECSQCERLFVKSKRIAKNLLLCRECYLIAIQKEYKCKNCNRLISHKAIYCCECFQLKERNNNYKDGRTKKGAFCLDCNKKLKNYLSKRCWKCYKKWAKISTNNPRFGKIVPFFKIIYKNINFRSSWEVNFAKWLDLSNIKWEYESKQFEFIFKNNKTTYTPDFYLPEFDCYIEIKGWFPKKAKRRLKIFQKLFKELNFRIFNQKILKNIGIVQDVKTLGRVGIIYS